jgi:integrase
MSDRNATARRVRVERNIYRRPTGVFEVGFTDGAGTQRWRTVDGGITAARALRDELLAGRRRGERVAPNPRLGFAEASERWLAGPVGDLRPTTRALYRNALDQHLLPRYSTRRLDAISPDDVAGLVRELRAAGMAENSMMVILGVLGRIFKFAARRLSWSGASPVSLLLAAERPKPSRSPRRRIFEGAELEQTIAAAFEPYRTLFAVAALTGARVSELCGLTWSGVGLVDLDDAELEFAWQVDRQGRRRTTKTDGSARTVPIPRGLAAMLARHKLASPDVRLDAYVFATRTGRPLSQRNVSRALRAAQARATDARGRPTFPVLHVRDEQGLKLPAPARSVPSMHSFRHTVASRGLLAGESVDEIAFLLGHRDGNVTRAVYVREVADARRRSMRRGRMAAEFRAILEMPPAPASNASAPMQLRFPDAS